MAIHIIYGKPGSGKSFYATWKLLQELRESRRMIVTNLPLNIRRINEYLQERYPNETIDLRGRLFILDDQNLKNFFLWRGPSSFSALGLPPSRPSITDEMSQEEVDAILKAHGEAVKHYEMQLAKAKGDVGQMLATVDEEQPFRGADRGRGVAFFIDEAQIPFNARDWAERSMRPVFEYLTQHRKLGDEVWAMTQSPGNLDKQFRSLAQDFRKLRNERLIKLGMFRGFDRFTCRHFDVEPSGKQEAYYTERFQLDAEGIGSCYDTARGIGVQGNKADIGARAKGVTIGWGVAAIVAVCLSVLLVPKMLAAYFLDGKAKPAVQSPSREVKPAEPEKVTQANGSPESAPPLWVVGFLIRGDKVQVALSDGRTLVEGEPGLSRVDRAGVIYNGKRIFMRPVQPSEKAVQAQNQQPATIANSAIATGPKSRGSWRLDEDGVERLIERDELPSVMVKR